MKLFTHYLPVILFTITTNLFAQDSKEELPENIDNIIALDDIKAKNAGIKTIEPELSNFETTLFTIGRIEYIPSKRTVVSSRIAGKVISPPPLVGDLVVAGQTVIKVESRQPGSPPPVIPLKVAKGGMVFESHVNLGQPVEPSEELMDVIDIRQVWAVANIPESKAAHVKLGQKAYIRVISLGDKVFTGELIRFGTEVDKDTGTVKAIFLIENSELLIRPNMLTEFNIVISSREKVLSIPKTAIQGDTMNAHVFKRDYDIPNAFLKVPVVVGEVNHDRAEIILQDKELNVVDEVVSEGGYFLSHTSANKADLIKALDEAHGHKHNPDGSEMSPDQVAAEGGATGGEARVSSTERILLYVSNGILLALFIFTLLRKKDIS